MRCNRTTQRHGHPGQRWIRPSELRPYLKAAKKLLRRNRKHPGIILAIQRLDLWITGSAMKRLRSPAEREAALLHEHGITGRDVLSRLLAVAFLNEWEPGTFISHEAYKWALARYCLSNWKRIPRGQRKISPRAFRECGQLLISTVGVLLLNAARSFVKTSTTNN